MLKCNSPIIYKRVFPCSKVCLVVVFSKYYKNRVLGLNMEVLCKKYCPSNEIRWDISVCACWKDKGGLKEFLPLTELKEVNGIVERR